MPNSRQAMPAKIGEKADDGAAHRGRFAQQAGHHHAVHQRDAGAHAAGILEKRARLLELRLGRIPHADHRGQRIGRAEARAVGRLALDLERVGPGEPAGRGAPTRNRAAGPRRNVRPRRRGPAPPSRRRARRRPARRRPRCGASAARPGRRWSPAAASRATRPRPRARRRRWRNGRRPWRRGRSSPPPGWSPRRVAPGPISIAIFRVSPSVTPPEVVSRTACGGSPSSGLGNKTRQGSR